MIVRMKKRLPSFNTTGFFLIMMMVCVHLPAHAQNRLYSSGSTNDLISFESDCTTEMLGTYTTFVDIAVTPNGTLYGIAFGLLLRIDPATTSYDTIGPLRNNGTIFSSVGLVALDNDYLLGEYYDSLVKIDVTSGEAETLGLIGHYCSGDFAFFQNKLYMSSVTGYLIKMQLDPVDHHIVSVKNVGPLTTRFGHSVYALFTAYEGCSGDKALFGIEENKVYKIDTTNAHATEVCYFDNGHGSMGAASLYDFDTEKHRPAAPNIFTPNNDGLNDYFRLGVLAYVQSNFEVNIYNRWGQKVYSSGDPGFMWDGTNSSGNNAAEGVYFYMVSYLNYCNEQVKYTNTLSLIR